MPPLDTETARTRLLDAGEVLFHARGIQSVGMDEIRAVAGLPLERRSDGTEKRRRSSSN
jgi:AcrR family transcriptional regulator